FVCVRKVFTRVVELVDTRDLKSRDQQWSCGFNSHPGYWVSLSINFVEAFLFNDVLQLIIFTLKVILPLISASHSRGIFFIFARFKSCCLLLFFHHYLFQKHMLTLITCP